MFLFINQKYWRTKVTENFGVLGAQNRSKGKGKTVIAADTKLGRCTFSTVRKLCEKSGARAVAVVAATSGPPAGDAGTATAACVAAVLQPCFLHARHASSRRTSIRMRSPCSHRLCVAADRRKPSSGRRSVGQPWSARPKVRKVRILSSLLQSCAARRARRRRRALPTSRRGGFSG